MIRSVSRRIMIAMGAVFGVVHIILGVLALDMVSSVWPTLWAMLIFSAAMAMTLSPPYLRLSLGRSAAVVACVGGMSILVDMVLPKNEWPGYASWHLAATYTLLIIVNIRGRVLISWIGAALSIGLTTVWAAGTGLGVAGGLVLSIATVGWLTVSTGVGHLLRTNDRKVNEYTTNARIAADWYASDRALNVVRAQWIEHVRDVAGPALQRAAEANGSLIASHREELKLIEAQFRDEIRGRSLATAEVIDAARRARQRGVTVELLDDVRQNLTPRMLATVSENVVSVLNKARGGCVTARAKPRGGALTVTIVTATTDAAEDATLIEISDQTIRKF